MSLLLGLVFLISGVGKLPGQSAFLLNIESALSLPPIVITVTTNLLPWVEVILGACLIIGIAVQFVALLSTALIAAFILHNSWIISLGLGYRPCPCLGVFERVFEGRLSTTGSLYIDIGLFALALIIYFGYPGKSFDVHPWFQGKVEQQMPKDGEDD